MERVLVVIAVFIGLLLLAFLFHLFKLAELRLRMNKFRNNPPDLFYIKTIHGYTRCRLITAYPKNLYVRIDMKGTREYYKVVPRDAIYPDWYVKAQDSEPIVMAIKESTDVTI